LSVQYCTLEKEYFKLIELHDSNLSIEDILNLKAIVDLQSKELQLKESINQELITTNVTLTQENAKLSKIKVELENRKDNLGNTVSFEQFDEVLKEKLKSEKLNQELNQEVDRLTSSNTQTRNDFFILKEENDRLKEILPNL